MTANYGGNTVSVLLNNGDGTFATQLSYPTGNVPTSVALGDMNGDGKLDIVTANSADNSAGVLLGKGDGTFGLSNAYSVGFGPIAIAIADANGDNTLDIITANSGSGSSVSVLLNQITPLITISGVVTFQGILSTAPAQSVTFQLRSTTGNPLFTRTATVAPNGTFALLNVPENNYNLRVKSNNYLASAVPVNAINGFTGSVAVTLLAGDVNNDNYVDLGDFGLLVNSYGSAQNDGTGLYNPYADFNGDGFVDIGDFGLFVSNFGDIGAQ